jgi:hypothetical protein
MTETPGGFIVGSGVPAPDAHSMALFVHSVKAKGGFSPLEALFL